MNVSNVGLVQIEDIREKFIEYINGIGETINKIK